MVRMPLACARGWVTVVQAPDLVDRDTRLDFLAVNMDSARLMHARSARPHYHCLGSGILTSEGCGQHGAE